MDIKDYRVWVALCVALLFAVAALFFFGRTPVSDVPIGVGTEPPPLPARYLNFQARENDLLGQIENNPEDARLLARLGDLYFENESFSQAAFQYEKALKLDPEDVDTYNDLGLAYHYTGRSALAVETLRKGTRVDPSFQRIWLSLGFVLASSGQGPQAEEALQEAIRLNPSNNVGLEAQRIMDSMKNIPR